VEKNLLFFFFSSFFVSFPSPFGGSGDSCIKEENFYSLALEVDYQATGLYQSSIRLENAASPRKTSDTAGRFCLV
jgi:hypothetical protein